MTLVKEGSRAPQEPVVKMASDIGVKEIRAILGPGETDWFRRELFFLDYPDIAVRLSFETQAEGPPKLVSLSVERNVIMRLENAACVLDMDDGSVTFANLVQQEEELGNRVRGVTLSTRQKQVDHFNIPLKSVPVWSRRAYPVKVAEFFAE